MDSLTIGDFNDDGHVDLYVAIESAYGYIFLGVGDGTFRAGIRIKQETYATAADVNADGILDLILSENGVCASLGRGDGTFAPCHDFPAGYVTQTVVADFNGDGLPDIAGNPHTQQGQSASVSVLLHADCELPTPGP